jgi:hypothetical protein
MIELVVGNYYIDIDDSEFMPMEFIATVKRDFADGKLEYQFRCEYYGTLFYDNVSDTYIREVTIMERLLYL